MFLGNFFLSTALREKMGATIIPHVPMVIFSREVKKQKEIIEPNTEIIEIENKLKKNSIGVISTDIVPDKDGFLTYKGRKVAELLNINHKIIDTIDPSLNCYSTFFF